MNGNRNARLATTMQNTVRPGTQRMADLFDSWDSFWKHHLMRSANERQLTAFAVERMRILAGLESKGGV